MKLSRTQEKFLRGQDTCRVATVDKTGYPHCVPVGYFYHRGTIYMPTVNLTKKARNLLANPKCCVVVDVLDAGEGKGLVFQGQAKIVFGPAFARLGRTIERLAGWHLDKWEIGGTKPNSIIEFRPERVAEIGRV